MSFSLSATRLVEVLQDILACVLLLLLLLEGLLKCAVEEPHQARRLAEIELQSAAEILSP